MRPSSKSLFDFRIPPCWAMAAFLFFCSLFQQLILGLEHFLILLDCNLFLVLHFLDFLGIHLFMIDVIADCFRKFSWSESSSSSKPVLDIPPVRVPEHLDKPVVHDGLRRVEGHGRLLCAVKCDESRAWVSLKLDLDILKSSVSTEVPIEMCDGVEGSRDISHCEHAASQTSPASSPTSATS